MKLINLFEAKSNVKFHGGYIRNKKRPIFFTDKFEDAKEFVDMYPNPKGEFVVYEAELTMNKPARLKDLKAAIKSTGATEKDVKSSYDDIDDSDYLFAPKVLEELKRLGFDSWIGKGDFDSFSINEYVIFDYSQMKLIKTHIVE